MTLQEFYENYKSMQEKCLTSGRAIPVLISSETVPLEYKLSKEEMMALEIDEDKLRKSHLERYRVELSIYNGENRDYGDLAEFYVDEFNGFLNDFPEFRHIFH